MRMIRGIAVALFAAAVLVGRATADDPKAVIEKAVKAHGGMEKLEKYKAAQVKAKGTLSIMGIDAEFSMSMSSMSPDKSRNEIKLEIMGQTISIVQVFNGTKGWVSTQGMTMEMDGDALDNMKYETYADEVQTLYPLLKDKKFELKESGEEMVDGKPAVAVKVSSKGQKDITLYFDKENGMLVKTLRKAKDPGQMEVDSESFFRGYKAYEGVQQATKMEVKHDGKTFLKAETTEVKLMEKLDDSVFAKPD